MNRKGKQGRKRLWRVVLVHLLIGMVGAVAYLFKAYSDIGSTAESIYTSVNVNEMREEEIEVETATQPISFLLLGADTGSAEEERTETGPQRHDHRLHSEPQHEDDNTFEHPAR